MDELINIKDLLVAALEALNKNAGEFRVKGARQILRTAIEAAEKQEPVAWAEEIIADLHACYGSELIKQIDSGDALIRLDAAIACVEEAAERHTTTPAAPVQKGN
jgi:hypothetical protein